MPEWMQVIVGITGPSLLALMAWQIRLLFSLRSDVRETNIVLFGRTGDNGINGDVKGLRKARHETDTTLTALLLRADTVENRLDRANL